MPFYDEADYESYPNKKYPYLGVIILIIIFYLLGRAVL